MYQEEDCGEIFTRLHRGLPKIWHGRECIRYMKENNCNQWRQMEWPGFYFQFMCENLLSEGGFMQIPGPRYGNVEFDGLTVIPWDFKAHSIDRAMPDKEQVPTNGYAESLQAVNDYGSIGFIIISGDTGYDDENQSFKKWHDELKGGASRYEMERIARSAPSRRRKVLFIPRELIFVFVDKSNINSCGKFQSNFRNSDGSARNAKILLDLKRNDQLITFRLKLLFP